MLSLLRSALRLQNKQPICLHPGCEISLRVTTGQSDEVFMRAALRAAQSGLGQTSPNPAVGAVLVIDRKIVAKGHHKSAGGPHAELECLRRFKKPIPNNATLYVTLEPCSTIGRTGSCTD